MKTCAIRPLVLWSAIGLAVLSGCTGQQDPAEPTAASVTPATPAVKMDPADAEFSRRMRLARDQMRRYLPESAKAELDKAALIRPDDPELLFHRARLELIPDADGRDPAAAEELLEKTIALEPKNLPARRLLYELLYESGRKAEGRDQLFAIRDSHGQLGGFEMLSHNAYLTRGKDPYLRIPEEQPETLYLEQFRALRDALLRLNRDANYAPSEAVPVVERVLNEFPGLPTIRLSYAKKLVFGEVRVNYSTRPGLAPMSSVFIFDMAQLHLETVFDQIDPASRMALDIIFNLSYIALAMADFDESVAHLDVLLGLPGLPDGYRRFLIGRRALARYKQGRYGEAIDLLDNAVQGAPEEDPTTERNRWVLHLAHEAAGTPVEDRRNTFRLRPDLLRPPGGNRFSFRDVAPELGINKLDGAGPSAWGDYDRDGDLDLFVTGADSYGALYRNDGTGFTDVSREAGLFHVQSGFSTTFVDFDADGWTDLHIGRDGWSGLAPNSIYRNNRDGSFTDVTERANIAHPGSSFVCAWSDVDRDGDLDLAVANGITGGGDTNVLYRNNGDGSFTDVTVEAGLQEPEGVKTIGLTFGDYDLDGWPDLFVSGFYTVNRLYRNKGDGTFEEVAAKVGVASPEDRTAGYVAFFFDFDNDLDLDILRTALAPWPDVLLGLSDRWSSVSAQKRKGMLRNATKLYRNDGDGTFTEIGEQAGFVHPVGTMGAGVADLDNDGHQDIYLATGDPSIERMEPDRFYRNNGDGTFTDVTFPAGVPNIGKGHGVTFMDFDGDGDLEIYAPEGGFVHGDPWPNAFYLNEQQTGNHWLHVDLEGTESNRDALDTKLYVHAGGKRYLREVHNGEGFGCSNSPTVEFGLGAAEKVDRLEIHWPSGTVQTFEDVPVDRRISVREGAARFSSREP